MKRMHVHLSVSSLEASIEFYSTLFGSEPSVRKDDYAKWMLEDPRLNFAISTRGDNPGLEHFGFQVDSEEELDELRASLTKTPIEVENEGETICCYSHSDKSWIEDPDSNAWEIYRSMGEAQYFRSNKPTSLNVSQEKRGGCC